MSNLILKVFLCLLLLGTWEYGLDKVNTEFHGLSSTDCSFQGLSRYMQTLFVSHSPQVIHLSHSTQSNCNKPQHQKNIKMIVVVIIFGHNFELHSFQNRHSRSCTQITASNSEKLTSHLLATWTVYSSFNTNYAQMLHEHWPWFCIWTLHRY